MYKFKIICVGKLKEKYYLDMENEYLKRLSKYAKIDLIEVKDEKILNNSSIKEDEEVKRKEYENIMSKIDEKDYVILLDLHGVEYDSLEFCRHFDNILNKRTNIIFVIAGSLGYSDLINKFAKEKIKLSSLTFTHQMSRIILLEQLYRSFKIMNNETYHK